jgi:hypothetical protein|nr:MAG TPA: hypothetical protein [Bacteriophage sp.]
MKELRETLRPGVSFFNRIVIRPNVRDVVISSITAIDSTGRASPVISFPLELDEPIVIKNKHRNSMAIEVAIIHEHIEDGDSLSKFVDIDANRISTNDVASLRTKKTEILNSGSVNVVIKGEDLETAIISGNISITGYSRSGVELMDEKVTLGLGKTREVVLGKEPSKYKLSGAYKYRDGMTSKDEVVIKDGKIGDRDESCLYIASPDYVGGLYKNENIAIDENNSIRILNPHVYKVSCYLDAIVIDPDKSEPSIKYVGIISK